MKKYCIYTRVSTEEQGRSGLGLEAQLDQCREYIARTHGQNIGEFRDIRSGKDRNRPGLRRAMELAAREGATLIVAKLDRLSRDAEYALYLRNTGGRSAGDRLPRGDNDHLFVSLSAWLKQSANLSRAERNRRSASGRSNSRSRASSSQGRAPGDAARESAAPARADVSGSVGPPDGADRREPGCGPANG